MTWLCDYVLERGGHDSRAGGDERKKKDQEDEEETPPPLPPRQRPEVTDEPFPKKSRTNNHGMLQTKHFSETNKNKSWMRCLCSFMPRRGKRQKDDNAARKSS